MKTSLGTLYGKMKPWLMWSLPFLLISLTVYAFERGVERGKDEIVIQIDIDQKYYCTDSQNRRGWLAFRGGEARCFHEHSEYPHRARGSHIVTEI